MRNEVGSLNRAKVALKYFISFELVVGIAIYSLNRAKVALKYPSLLNFSAIHFHSLNRAKVALKLLVYILKPQDLYNIV